MRKCTFFSSFTLNCNKNIVVFDRPCVFGILNATPDSFYDGGQHTTPEAIVAHARQLLADGADVIDVGVVSSRPGAILLPPDDEARRLSDVIALLRRELPPDIILSADTCYALPAEAAVKAGANIINDISGGQFDERMFHAVADLQVPYILSHTRGLPSEMARLTHYDDLLREVQLFFSQRLDQLYSMGVSDVMLDPGFGFAKTADQNYELLAHLDDIAATFREPVMAGISRKRMIYETLATTPQEALNGTTAANTIALLNGARLLRVHDPRPARDAIAICQRLWSNT